MDVTILLGRLSNPRRLAITSRQNAISSFLLLLFVFFESSESPTLVQANPRQTGFCLMTLRVRRLFPITAGHSLMMRSILLFTSSQMER
jgi:hypothetical protein